MYASEFHLRPAVGLGWPLGVAYALTALAVASLPLEPRWIKPLLALALLGSCGWNLARLRREAGCILSFAAGGWRLTEGARTQTRTCSFDFVSPLLVVLKAKEGETGRSRRLAFTPQGGGAEAWRKLHVCATIARESSGVADDHVLGGKVDRHQDGVPGNL